MEKSNKRKKVENIFLLIIFLVLAVVVVILYNRNVEIDKEKKAKEAEAKKNEEMENVTLIDIGYGSEIQQIGRMNAKAILDSFIVAYNTKSGEDIVSMSDFPAQYIFSQEVEEDIEKFDEKYVEILSNPREYDNFVLMSSVLPKLEESAIEALKGYNVTLELIDYTEIEDVTRYISKLTADVKIYSEEENMDEVCKLEFLLLHRDKSYYIINYYMVGEDGNKI